jgi:hypothetical protein
MILSVKPKQRKGNQMEKETKKQIRLEIEELEERVAPSQPPGLLGYEGQPGNQGGHNQPPGLLGYEGQPGNQGG